MLTPGNAKGAMRRVMPSDEARSTLSDDRYRFTLRRLGDIQNRKLRRKYYMYQI